MIPPLVLEDSNGLLWTISVNAWGQIVATAGATGTAVGVYLNDSNGGSWLLSFNPTTQNIETSPVTPARNFPTSIAINEWWILGVGAGSTEYTQLAADNFTRANENPINPANWTVVPGFDPLEIVSDLCQATDTFNDCGESYTGITFPDNQYAEITIAGIATDDDEAVVICRQNGLNLYAASVSGPLGAGTEIDLTLSTSSGQTELGSWIGTVNNGDKLRIGVIGGSVLVWLNLTLIISAVDTTIASGSPGISISAVSATSAVTISDFTAGSAASTGGLILIYPSDKLKLWQRTVISQYSNSPTLLALIEEFDAAVSPRGDIDNFYSWIWNIDTAQGFGLDIWGRIVGVSRSIPTSPTPTILTDAQFRSLILLKALSNISIATSPAINSLLRNWMAGRGKTYVNDLGQMEIRYSFEFALEPFEILIITESGIFLRPAGVGGWAVATAYPVFGFKEMGTTWAAPFNQEPFLEAGQPYAVS